MARSVKNLQTDFIKFHGCGAYRRDGTNVLCTEKNRCSNPINACFWMKNRHVIHKVRTRNSELNDNILYSNSVKTQYYNELHRQKQTQYYSTDESSYSDSDSGYSDSDSNNLIIDIDQTVNDINHSTKSISETTGEITKSKQLIHETVTSPLINETLNQVHEVTNTDQSQDLRLQSPNNKNKSIPLTI